MKYFRLTHLFNILLLLFFSFLIYIYLSAGEQFIEAEPLQNRVTVIKAQEEGGVFSDIDIDKQLIRYTIKGGDSFFGVVDRFKYKLPSSFSRNLVLKSNKNLRELLSKLKVGHDLYFSVDPGGLIHAIEIIDNLRTTKIDAFSLKHQCLREEDPYEQYFNASVEIKSSFIKDLADKGIPCSVIWKLLDIFSWDVDWQRQVRPGMLVNLIYALSYQHLEGQAQSYPLKAELIFSPNKKMTAYYHREEKAYVDEKGEFLKKGFIRNPLKFDRISSKFDLNRKHPILHTIRAHKGVDYAAKIGTTVKATGDGQVIFSGTKGGYGNVVEIKHGQVYTTLYAHLNAIEKNIKKGVRVKQGQKIGTVGMTGLATGPHLHYEFRVNGVHKDPLTVKIPSQGRLSQNDRKQFEKFIAQYNHLEKTAHSEFIAII